MAKEFTSTAGDMGYSRLTRIGCRFSTSSLQFYFVLSVEDLRGVVFYDVVSQLEGEKQNDFVLKYLKTVKAPFLDHEMNRGLGYNVSSITG